ncbi:D-glycero-alpha-D-manno-heptose-1,7-bisphosphate 7-phosphatase [Candidatus Undinarchaeota archaeon]
MKTIFLDRDGTIIKDKNYIKDPNDIEFFEGTIDTLKRLSDSGYQLVIISNQSGVGRGILTIEQMNEVNKKLMNTFDRAGIKFAGAYYCSHAPEDKCPCRKPNTGLIEKAKQDLEIDFTESWFVGDKSVDVALGEKIGVRTILLHTGYAGKDTEQGAKPDFEAETIKEAADIILSS